MLAPLMLLAANSADLWWQPFLPLAGVLIGGFIVTLTQVFLHSRTTQEARQNIATARQAASRVLRDDFRSIESRIYFAIRDERWWDDEDIAPLLHNNEDIRHIAAAVKSPVKWGDIASSRRLMMRIESRRIAGRPLNIDWLRESFWDLERARASLAKEVEGFDLKPLSWGRKLREMGFGPTSGE